MHFARPVNCRPRSSRKSLAFPRYRLARRLTSCRKRAKVTSLYFYRREKKGKVSIETFLAARDIITEEQRNVGRWTPAWRAATHFQFFSLPVYIPSIRSLTSVKLWIIRRFCKSMSSVQN